MSQALLQLFDELDADVAWLKANLDMLKKEHDGEFVAIKGRQIVGSDVDVERLIQKLKAKGVDAGDTLIQYISSIPVIY